MVLSFLIFLGLGFWLTPTILYAEKEQPFKFSHKVHLGQAKDMVAEGESPCLACHWFREDGSFSGLPSIEKCAECHDSESTLGNFPEEKVFVEKYLGPGKPVPWLVYSRQPDCVFFSHAAHTANAGLECTTCHGDHGQSDDLRPYVYNRITGYSRDIWGPGVLPVGPPNSMKMSDCADCHRDNGVRDACFVCHK